MKKLILTLSILTIILTASFMHKREANAYQQIDWVCMSQCQGAGHMYGYCQKICSY